MIQAKDISLKSVVPRRVQRAAKKFLVGLLMLALVSAGLYGWWRYNYARLVGTPATAGHPAPVTAKQSLAAASPKANDKSASTIIAHPVATKVPTVGFTDSLIAFISPSAKGATVQQEMQPASGQAANTSLPAKRMTLQHAPLFRSIHEPQPQTDEQKRLQVAQDGLSDVLDQARNYPDTFGFSTDDKLSDVTLGDAIPIYKIALQVGVKYTGQPVSSLLQPADEWVYPVILNDSIRYFVQVRYDGQGYVRDLGSRALAMEYDKILARWPASEGFHPKLITVPNQSYIYFTIPELPNQNITDASRMFDMNPVLSPADLVLANCF
jgi:hypothetical protein